MNEDYLIGLTGRVITPDSPFYEDARQEWNTRIQKYPLVIVYCFTKADVCNAVCWARKNYVCIRIRSGGHNYEGYSVGNGVLVIDVSEMKGIEVDTERNIVTVAGGVTNEQIYAALGEYGYPFPGGTCGTVGLSGLALGGGWGYLCRFLGLACDSLVELELVNFQGDVLTANASCNENLYWACRGAGGGNFGVVVSMTFVLPKKVSNVTLVELYCPDASPAVQTQFLDAWQHWLVDLDERFGMQATVSNSLDEGLAVYGRGLFFGSPQEASALLSPFFSLDGFTISLQVLPFPAAMKKIGDSYPASETFKSTGRFAHEQYSLQELQNVVNLIQTRPNGSVFASVGVYALGGKVYDVLKSATAFYYREAPYILNIQSIWTDPAFTEENVAWVDERFRYLQSITEGSYVNFPFSGLKYYEAAYFGENVPRLRNVKEKYDPCNVFSFPQSIHD